MVGVNDCGGRLRAGLPAKDELCTWVLVDSGNEHRPRVGKAVSASRERGTEGDRRRVRRRVRPWYRWQKAAYRLANWLPLYIVTAVIALLVTIWAIHEK